MKVDDIKRSYLINQLGEFRSVEHVQTNQTLIKFKNGVIFQSYKSIIFIELFDSQVYYLGENWNYSNTTRKYRNMVLRRAPSTKAVDKDLLSGVAVLVEEL